MKLDIDKSQKQIESSYSFTCVSNKWYHTIQPHLKTSSKAKYHNILTNYLLPEMGEKDIQTITREQIWEFTRRLSVDGGIRSKGLSSKTVNDILSVIKNIFNFATNECAIKVVSLDRIFIKQQIQPLIILSSNEQQKLRDYLVDNLNPCHLGILLCMYTGIRIGEICALKWGDILLDEQLLFIHHSMQRVQTNTGERKTEVIITTPKSKCSIRKIPLPNRIVDYLVLFRKEDNAYILTGNTDNFMEPRCLTNRFKSILIKCDINNTNFHSLRHTFATRCIELEFDLKSLSEILGHSNINITLNRYVHPSMEIKSKNMNKLSALL